MAVYCAYPIPGSSTCKYCNNAQCSVDVSLFHGCTQCMSWIKVVGRWIEPRGVGKGGAFQSTMWLVWNKLASSKTFLWRRQKILWDYSLLGREINGLGLLHVINLHTRFKLLYSVFFLGQSPSCQPSCKNRSHHKPLFCAWRNLRSSGSDFQVHHHSLSVISCLFLISLWMFLESQRWLKFVGNFVWCIFTMALVPLILTLVFFVWKWCKEIM